MPRSDETTSFFFAVYAAVQEIPRGKVTSYGHIATLIGTPQRPRQVGVCLKHLPDPPDPPDPDDASAGAAAAAAASGLARFHSGNVPWQRVLSAKGVISPRGNDDGGGGRRRQAAALQAEGVEVGEDGLGQPWVDLGRFGWFPARLPSEEGEEADDADADADGEP